jgi:hypothetical protein
VKIQPQWVVTPGKQTNVSLNISMIRMATQLEKEYNTTGLKHTTGHGDLKGLDP